MRVAIRLWALSVGLGMLPAGGALAQSPPPQGTKPGAGTKAAPPASGKSAAVELETYEGRLLANDTSFRLHIYEGSRATAEWERAVGESQRYQGTYSGSDGNYSVKLTGVGSTTPLNLTLHSLGGMVNGSFTTGPDTAREVAQLKLTQVYTPTAKLKGASGRQSGNGASRSAGRSRNGSSRRGAGYGRRASRRRQIIVPGIGNGIHP